MGLSRLWNSPKQESFLAMSMLVPKSINLTCVVFLHKKYLFLAKIALKIKSKTLNKVFIVRVSKDRENKKIYD
jgi:hypothetical protein